MSNDIEAGKKIVELYEKKIESQSTISVGFFGASIFIFSSYFTRAGQPLDLSYEWILWLSYIAFGAVVVTGYLARMSLIACVPSMLNYAWGKEDAASASYDGKDVLEGFMMMQVAAFLIGLVLTGIFFALNMRSFVA